VRGACGFRLRQHNCVAAVAGELEVAEGGMCAGGGTSIKLVGGFVRIASFEDGVITLATLIISRMVSATGRISLGVPTFCAVRAVMWATAFDTCRVCCSTFVCVCSVDIMCIVGYDSCLCEEVRYR
jgi:hypothetical protein